MAFEVDGLRSNTSYNAINTGMARYRVHARTNLAGEVTVESAPCVEFAAPSDARRCLHCVHVVSLVASPDTLPPATAPTFTTVSQGCVHAMRGSKHMCTCVWLRTDSFSDTAKGLVAGLALAIVLVLALLAALLAVRRRGPEPLKQIARASPMETSMAEL